MGCQLLHTSSSEFGHHEGLNLIDGHVDELPKDERLAIPHVGWSNLELTNNNKTILSHVKKNEYFYFTHSFYCNTFNENNILARFNYGSK